MEDWRFIESNVCVFGGLLDAIVPSYCNQYNEVTIIEGIYSTIILLTIAHAHSFIMNGIKGIESPVAESIYIYSAL